MISQTFVLIMKNSHTFVFLSIKTIFPFSIKYIIAELIDAMSFDLKQYVPFYFNLIEVKLKKIDVFLQPIFSTD